MIAKIYKSIYPCFLNCYYFFFFDILQGIWRQYWGLFNYKEVKSWARLPSFMCGAVTMCLYIHLLQTCWKSKVIFFSSYRNLSGFLRLCLLILFYSWLYCFLLKKNKFHSFSLKKIAIIFFPVDSYIIIPIQLPCIFLQIFSTFIK